MCGIAGLVSAAPGDPAAHHRTVMRMREALAHRGPDGWGLTELAGERATTHSAKGVTALARQAGSCGAWLGHQRLAIIDLSDAAAQPARSADGSGWLAFNGEIYNFRDLQRSYGAARSSNSDSVVLLDLIAARGLDVLREARGMFAFAYWNEREQALYLARDRFGIKPLYWCRPSPGMLVFASEPRALAAAGFAGELDPRMDAAFLRQGHMPIAGSAFKGLEIVPPGSYLRFDPARNEARITRWFEPAEILGRPGTQRVEEAARIFQSALDDSVRAHLVSDVPVGLFLSGGLDSAALVASAARAGGGPLQTFTVIVPGSAADESAPARAIADQFGTRHTEVPIAQPELGRWIEEALETMAEPTYDGLNTFIVSKAVARAGIKVVLSGLGGDELLGGYPSFRDLPVLWRATAPFRAGLPGRHAAARLARVMPVAAPGKLAEIVGAPARTRAGLWRQYRSLFERNDILRLTGSVPPPDDEGADYPDRPMLDVVMMCELQEYMAPQLLRDSDVFSMAVGLELRVPFVDHRLMQQVHAGGWWSRGRERSHKAAIFAAMPSPLPRHHLSRKKAGFTLPMGDWLRSALRGDPDLAVLRGPLSNPRLRPFVESFQAGRLDPNRLWSLVVREHVLRVHRPGVL